MRLGNYRWLLSLLTLFAYPSLAYSDSWVMQSRNYVDVSPQVLCERARLYYSIGGGGGYNYNSVVLSITPVVHNSGNPAFNCNLARTTGELLTPLVMYRDTSCPSGTAYDFQTNTCKNPDESKCESLEGTPRPFSKVGQAPDAYASISGGNFHKAQSACFDTCVANTTDQDCTVKTSGNYVCRGTAWFTGAECGTSDSATVDETETTTRPEPEAIEEKEPCIYRTLPDGTQSCKSLTNNEKEGQSCGTFNGVQRCADKNPTQNKVEIDTKVETEAIADGKTKITKTDTASITKCKGINDCKTESTTTKTVTVKNGEGETESSTGTCTGPACPDKNGNPDANGDGLGDCSTGDCGEGEGEGDEDGGGWYEGTDDTFASVLQAFADDVAQIPMVDGIGNFLTFSPGGSCPAGYITAWVFSIELDQWCGDHIPWSLIASVVLAAAAFLSYRIAFT